MRTPRNFHVAEFPLFDDGQHGDGNAQDGTWAAAWSSAAAPPGEYDVDLVAQDGRGNRAVYDQRVSFTTGPSPWVRYVSHVLARGDRIVAGERNRFGITVSNRGTDRAAQPEFWVSCSDPWIAESTDALSNRLALPALPASASVTSERNAFALDVLPTAPEGHIITVRLEITNADGHYWQEAFELPPVGQPES